MSRSGYTDCCDGWDLIRWRGAVASAMRGKRGQAFLAEMLTALDAMTEKRLVTNALVRNLDDALRPDLHLSAGVCAMGSVGVQRGIDMSGIDPEDREDVAVVFGIAPAMAAEIAAVNDDDFGWRTETPEERFARVRNWVVQSLQASPTPPSKEE